MKTSKHLKMPLLLALLLPILLVLTGCDAFDSLIFRMSDTTLVDRQNQSGFGEREPQPFPVVIDNVVIEFSPAEIISLSPALTEILFEFGQGSRLVGRSRYCNYPPGLSEIEEIGSGSEFNVDIISAIRPDLLLLSSPITEKDRIALERAGVTTLNIPAPRNLDEFRNIYRIIGLVLQGGFIGIDEGDYVFSDINLACNNPGVIDLGDFIYITENMAVATGDTLESSILSCFGNNLAYDGREYIFDLDSLLENQPDLIILNNIFGVEDLLEHEIFSQLEAVAEGRIITLNNAYFERPSSRILSLISSMQSQFHDLS